MLIAAPIFSQQSTAEEGTLTVNITDTFGSKVTRGMLSIKSSEGGVVYSAEVQSQAVVHLAYGKYSIEFEANWYKPSRRDVLIHSAESFATLAALFVSQEEKYTPGSISIKVDPAKSCTAEGSLWAKLVGVYTQDAMEQHISPRGYALFEPVDRGSYLVIVIDGSKVRATLPIAAEAEVTTATVTLPPCQFK